MKKVFFVASIALVGLSAAFAQDKQQSAPAAQQTKGTSVSRVQRADGIRSVTPEKIAETRTARLNKEVSLTADQQKKAYDLFLKEAQENKGRAMNRQETSTELKAILTAEQNQKMEAVQAERKQKMQERRAQRSEQMVAPATSDKVTK